MNIEDIKLFRRQSDATILDILEQHRTTNEALTLQVERAFQMLEMNGVSRERAKYVSNGIDVLATRMRRDIQDSKALSEALAARVEQMRVALERQWGADDALMNAAHDVAKVVYEAALEEHSASHDALAKLLTTDDTATAILAERDARTLRMAAERCAELGARFYEHARAPYADCALLLLAMADELAKAGATEKKP